MTTGSGMLSVPAEGQRSHQEPSAHNNTYVKLIEGCSVTGCDRPHLARGWCKSHYAYWHRTGREPLRLVADLAPEARFWSKVDKSGECWLWTGATGGRADIGFRYGRFYLDGATHQAHLISFRWAGGVVPEGYDVDHLCRTTLCVRPSHLEAVTHRENLMRGDGACARHARKTHCIRGHEFTPENTRAIRRGDLLWRECRACDAIRAVGKARRRSARRLVETIVERRMAERQAS